MVLPAGVERGEVFVVGDVQDAQRRLAELGPQARCGGATCRVAVKGEHDQLAVGVGADLIGRR